MGAKLSSKKQQQQQIITNKQLPLEEPPMVETYDGILQVQGVYVGGISLKYILELVNNRVASRVTQSWANMEDFVENVIVPETKRKNESYLQKLSKEKPDKVKPVADHFVSYVWSYILIDELLASLRYTLLEKTNQDDDVYVWLDAFCVNQHQISSNSITANSPEQLQLTFGESLKAIGSMVMVLTDWMQPEYARRIWCVFESYMAKKNDIPIILAMSKKEEGMLVSNMVGNMISDNFLMETFGGINVESAKAKKLQDQQVILHLIREFGVADVSSVILDNLKQWIVQAGVNGLKNVQENSPQACKICNALYMVHTTIGEFDPALEWVQKTLDAYIKLYGPEHEYVGTIYNNLACCLQDLGRLDEALAANEHDWVISSKILDADHPNLLRCRARKGVILQAQGNLEEALLIFKEVAQTSKRIFGESSESTQYVLVEAICLRQLKRLDEALALMDQVIDFTKRDLAQTQLGNNQPYVADRLYYKAQCLQEMGRPSESIELCDHALGIHRKAMGANSRQTSNCLLTKGRCLDDLQRYDEALDLFNQCLAIRRKIYKGNEHADVGEVLHYKGLCLTHLGKVEEGLEVGKQSVGIYERKLGKDHPITVEIRNVWV
jgi:tetratricopeptide (TPR) repeat protein